MYVKHTFYRKLNTRIPDCMIKLRTVHFRNPNRIVHIISQSIVLQETVDLTFIFKWIDSNRYRLIESRINISIFPCIYCTL